MPNAGPPVVWTLVADVKATLAALQVAVDAAGCRLQVLSPEAVAIDVPRSFRHRRPAARHTGLVAADNHVTDIVWAAEPADRTGGNLATVLAHLPERILHDHGLRRAAAEAGLPPFAAADLRALSAVFQGRETVRALGAGRSGETPGTVALTDRRLVFAGHSTAHQGSFLSLELDSVRSLTLGKQTSGETLTLIQDTGSTSITHLGHGEGHGIVRKFRAAAVL